MDKYRTVTGTNFCEGFQTLDGAIDHALELTAQTRCDVWVHTVTEYGKVGERIGRATVLNGSARFKYQSQNASAYWVDDETRDDLRRVEVRT